MSSEDAATHAAVDLTHALINPTHNIPLTTLVNNQTAAIQQITVILNITATPQEKPPPNKITQYQKTPIPYLMVYTP